MKNKNRYESPIIEEVKLDTTMSLMLQSMDDYPDVGPGEAYISSDNPVLTHREMLG